MADKQKFPSEVIDLPSSGQLYAPDSPLHAGKIEIKYMTAKEEDILTSQNLIKKGIVIDTLLNELILTKGITVDDLLLGDKNAVMVAARILAYGPEYTIEVTHPTTGEKIQHTFNLADCPFKKIPDDAVVNEFEIVLPISKVKVKFKLLTGIEEKQVEKELQQRKKLGSQISPELTTRLKHAIIAVDGDTKSGTIHNFVDNLLSKDSFHLRQEMNRVAPDIELKQELDWEGETVMVDIPMAVDFFWPNFKS